MPVLAGTIPSFEMLMTQWETIKKDLPHLGPFIDMGLDKAYKYYKKMDQMNAYAVAMCKFFFFFCLFCFDNDDVLYYNSCQSQRPTYLDQGTLG